MQPDTGYAKSGEFNIAYQVFGDGPLNLVVVFGYISHLDLLWTNPGIVHFMERLGKFARVVLFDKRGVGLSDRTDVLPTLEERMDDLHAVMDAAGTGQAALLGLSEGVPMSILFAASFPERVSALALYGGMARSTKAEDYPWASPVEALREASEEFFADSWGQGDSIEVFAPSVAENPDARAWVAKFERQAASPRAMGQLTEMFYDIDVRHVVPSVTAPTLVLQRRGDRVVNVGAGRWLAEHLPNVTYKEFSGIDHNIYVGNVDELLDEIEEFLTGVRPAPELDRVLATVVFTDIVDSTKRAAELGDQRWREILASHDRLVRSHIQKYRGREVKTTGDGFLATFDGPARAIRCVMECVEEVKTLGIDIRAGLHCGEVEIIGDDIGGIAVNIAARVGALASTGEVLASRTVRDLVAGSGIGFEDRGETELKGVPEKWQLYSIKN